jgi:histidinol-phosphate aminotransferase
VSSGLPLRAELSGVLPYGAPELQVPTALNVNENPYGPPPVIAAEMADVVRDLAGRLNRYPDREARALREDLAAYLGHGLTADRVWAGNGSNEVMMHVLQAFGGPGRAVLSFEPTYSMYPEYARSTATRWVGVPRALDFSISADEAAEVVRREAPAVTLLCSPNNPTGTALPLPVIEAVCRASEGVVVVDEAYAEFRRPGVPSALSLLDTFPRLAVARTMSKAFGLAGLRLGYLACSEEMVDALRLVRLPYHLSGTTQAIGRVALAHAVELLAAVDLLRAERDDTVLWLREQGFRVADSDANFVLFGTFDDAHQVWQRLLDGGVLVRETRAHGWLRVSIGTPEEMAAFRSALLALDVVRREEVGQ